MISLLLALSAQAIDLDTARDHASNRAAAVEVARAEADAAEASARASRGVALPNLTGFANITVGDGYTSIGFERPVPWQGGIGVNGTWSLVNPAQWAAATSARRTARGRVALLAWSRALARQEVTAAYGQAQAAETTAQALATAAADAERARVAIDTLVEAGIRPPADSSRARADALDLTALAASAQGEVAVACAQLQALIDAPINGRCQVDPVDWSTQNPADGPVTHPALEAFGEAVGAAEATSQAAVWTQLPTLDANGTAAAYAVPERSGPGWFVSVGINVPLSFATTGLAEVRGARAEVNRASAELDQQARDLSVARVQAQARLDAARQVYTARAAGLDASQQAWTRVDSRFREGLEDLTTWLAARRVRIDAEVALANAQAALAASIAAVEAAAGVE